MQTSNPFSKKKKEYWHSDTKKNEQNWFSPLFIIGFYLWVQKAEFTVIGAMVS